MKIKIVKDFRTQGGSWIRAGEVFEARRIIRWLFDIDSPYQIISGLCSGCDVPFANAIQLPKERTYTEAEVAALKEQIDRVWDNQPKKIALPREVAEAIKHARRCKWSNSAILNVAEYIDEFRDVSRTASQERNSPIRKPIGEWLVKDVQNIEKFAMAILNGYTIEEPQTFQTNRKLDASEIKEVRRWYQGAITRIQDGTDPDGYCKEAIEEVALYLGGAALLKDISPFCNNQLERENAQQSG